MFQGNLETLVGPFGARTIERVFILQTGEEGVVRQAAVEALGGFESIRPVDLLVTRLSDGGIVVRRGAARALGRLGRQAVWVVEPLIVQFNDVDSGVRQNGRKPWDKWETAEPSFP